MKQRIRSASWMTTKKKHPKEQEKEKRVKKNEEGLREMQDNMKHYNICIIGIPEGEEEDQGIENLFEKVMMENFPNMPETPIQKNLCTPMFIAAQFTIAKYWKQPKCPSANEWVQKLWYIYTMEFYTAERKKELIPFATAWMELESIILSEISQAVRDKYRMISPLTGT